MKKYISFKPFHREHYREYVQERFGLACDDAFLRSVNLEVTTRRAMLHTFVESETRIPFQHIPFEEIEEKIGQFQRFPRRSLNSKVDSIQHPLFIPKPWTAYRGADTLYIVESSMDALTLLLAGQVAIGCRTCGSITDPRFFPTLNAFLSFTEFAHLCIIPDVFPAFDAWIRAFTTSLNGANNYQFVDMRRYADSKTPSVYDLLYRKEEYIAKGTPLKDFKMMLKQADPLTTKYDVNWLWQHLNFDTNALLSTLKTYQTARPIVIDVPVLPKSERPKYTHSSGESVIDKTMQNDVLPRFPNVRERTPTKNSAESYYADCPLCENNMTISLSTDGKTVLYKCHAGCPQSAIVAAVDAPFFLDTRIHTPKPKPRATGTSHADSISPTPALLYEPHTTMTTDSDGLPCLERYELTEFGTRQRYLAQFAPVLRYNHTQEQFMIYDAHRWTPDDTNIAAECVASLFHRLEGDAKQVEHLLSVQWEKETAIPFKAEKDRTKKETIRLKSQEKTKALLEQVDPLVTYARAVKNYCYEAKRNLKTSVSHIVSVVKHDQAIATTEDDYDSDPYLLNVQNGTLNLKTGELLTHDQTRLISKVTGTDYQPDATCPAFQTFLNLIFKHDADIIRYVQRAFGYSLTGLSDEKVLLFCYGMSGDNGKSTLFNAVKMILGDYFQTAQADILMESRRAAGGALEGLAKLKGARCVVCDELSGASTLDIATVKRLTGADHEIKARFLYGHEFSFKPSHTIWMFGNEKPRLSATDNATWNRVKLIPFEYAIPKSDQKPMEYVMQTFQREAPGILNWMIDGWKIYRDDHKSLNIDVPDKIQTATQAYRDESDTLRNFLEERFVSGYDIQEQFLDAGTMLQRVKTPRPEVWSAYKTWCLTYHERKVKQSEFFTYLDNHGFPVREGRAHQYFVHGLKFSEDLTEVSA